MVPIQREQRVEVLQQYTSWLEAQVKELSSELKKLKGLNEGANSQEWLDAKLRDQLSRLQQKFFGAGQESLPPRDDRPVGHEQSQLKLHGEYPQEGKELPKEPFNPKGPVFFTCKMSERELAQESVLRGIRVGAAAWNEVPGLYQESREITTFERVYQEVLIRQCKYRLKAEFNDTGKEVLLTAPGIPKLRAGSKYSVDFGVQVVSDKYEYHLPLERQRRKMEAQGLKVDTKTLYSLCEVVAGHCVSIAARIKQDIFDDFCAVHVDESPWPILGQAKKTYMWVVSNRKGAYFQFEPTRSGAIAEELLKGYSGSVLTDGYGGYNRIKKQDSLRMGHCWSHVRREFFERIPDFPEDATAGVRLIDELFSIEARAKSFDELKVLRASESRIATAKFHAWMIETMPKYLSGSGLNQAISYTMKFWTELTAFLDDLSLPLSNNDAERSLRHVVMGRKNFNGSKTINGADTAASIYTVIESCKRVGLQPSQYLKYLIEGRWYGDQVKTPLEYSMEKLGPNKKVVFPKNSDWRIS